jgi:hypothetical protein
VCVYSVFVLGSGLATVRILHHVVFICMVVTKTCVSLSSRSSTQPLFFFVRNTSLLTLLTQHVSTSVCLIFRLLHQKRHKAYNFIVTIR